MNFSEFLWLDSSELSAWMDKHFACDDAIERFRGLSAAQAFLCLSPDTNDWELIRWVSNIVKSKHLRYLMSVYDTDLSHLTSKRGAYADVLISLQFYERDSAIPGMVWRLYYEARDRVTEVLREALTAIRDWARSRGDTPFLDAYKDESRFIWEIWPDVDPPKFIPEGSDPVGYTYDGGGVPASEGGGAYAEALQRLDPETLVGYWPIPDPIILLLSDNLRGLATGQAPNGFLKDGETLALINENRISITDREALARASYEDYINAREARHLASQDYGSDENAGNDTGITPWPDASVDRSTDDDGALPV